MVCCGVMLSDIAVGGVGWGRVGWGGGVGWGGVDDISWGGMGCVCVVFNMLHHLT